VAKSALKKPSPAKKKAKRHGARQGVSGRKLAGKPAKSVVVKSKKVPVKRVKVARQPVKTAKRKGRIAPAKAKRTAKAGSPIVGKSKSVPSTKTVPVESGQTPPVGEVATNLKPRKNQAGLLSRELEHFRDLLLEKRREIVGDMSSMEREALRSGGGSNLSTLPMHMADMGTDNYEQEFTLGLVEKDRNLLRDLNRALAKIQNGTYGLCEGTGKPIAKARLEVQPWAKFSIEYARKIELGGMGVR
jgi:RNA polymerase-binding protein DksA